MRGVASIALVGLLMSGCGGPAANAPAGRETRYAKPDEPDRGSEVDDTAMGDPDLMKRIHDVFERREPKIARCYSARMEEKKLGEGEFLVKVEIREGKATRVDVTGKQWQDDVIQGCIEKLVGEWSFPEAPDEVPFSYTYRFVPLT